LITKYRYKILRGALQRRVREIIAQVAEEFGIQIVSGGRLHPIYRQPFDMLAETNLTYQQKKAVSPMKNDLFDIWLPGTDSNRRQGG
tara:strand:- start:163 stop:423 length:261 start_codon:yes stop_codon:yes gene_type:complete